MSENNMFKLFMKEHPEENKNIIRKNMAIKLAPSPILYFSAVCKHNGIFPNTQIICGDIRQKNIMDLIIELEQNSTLNPKTIINSVFLSIFKEAWQTQLSVLISPEYLVIKNDTNALLLQILSIMTNNEVKLISNILNEKWINVSNISMLHTMIKLMTRDVDIVFFVGEIHMSYLIEEIEQIYPMLINETVDNNRTIHNNRAIINQEQFPK